MVYRCQMDVRRVLSRGRPRKAGTKSWYAARSYFSDPGRPHVLCAHSPRKRTRRVRRANCWLMIILGPASTTANWSLRKGGAPIFEGRLRIARNEGAIAAAVADAGIVMTSGGSLRREFEPGSFRRERGVNGTPTSPPFRVSRAASRTLARCIRIARVEDGRRWYLPEAHPSFQRPSSRALATLACDAPCCRGRR